MPASHEKSLQNPTLFLEADPLLLIISSGCGACPSILSQLNTWTLLIVPRISEYVDWIEVVGPQFPQFVLLVKFVVIVGVHAGGSAVCACRS
jgi:hypothetical protein